MNITERTTLEMTNVLSYRGKNTQQEISAVMNEIQEIIKVNEAEKVGPTVTATFAITDDSLLDIEVMIPLDKKISVSEKFRVKPLFRLTNAVKIRHEGSPATLQNSYADLMKYISNSNLIPITVGYNVTVKEALNPMDIDNMIVDIYVGVSDNIL